MQSKIGNDLRLLSTPPQSGLAEIALPPRRMFSLIMLGNVNPVMVNQICYAGRRGCVDHEREGGPCDGGGRGGPRGPGRAGGPGPDEDAA
ncbi:hypothetical protein ABZ445_39100 [Streptomyces chartreusis]|uniref:hypothetical protein n=1 Tax=Streptomyces chartreusis TaxID=1969 RepID=UPI0033E61F45